MILEQGRIEHQITQDEKLRTISPKTIPIIFHILFSNREERLSEDRIIEQLEETNAHFRLRDTILDHPNDPEGHYVRLAADTEIQFCFPSENSGVHYYTSNEVVWSNTIGIKEQVPPIDPDRNLNIWIVNLPANEGGFAQMPMSGAYETDGIVINYRYVGLTGAVAPYNEAKTLTHLLGNALGLFPLWRKGNCLDDHVADTPISNAPNAGCPSSHHVSTCEGYPFEMTMNFMDATNDACMYMFTKGQKKRMHAILAPDGARNLLAMSPTQCSESFKEQPIIELSQKSSIQDTIWDQTSLTVFPNPAATKFSVDLSSSFTKNTSTGSILQVFSPNGQIIASKNLEPDKRTYVFDTSTWSSGLYLIKVQQGIAFFSTKITIEK